MSLLEPFATDDELHSVGLKIREAGDLSTAINEGFGLRREVIPTDLPVAENAEALLQIMFSDELWQLEEALRKASDEPGLSPLVQSWLIFAQFWPRHEGIRRYDAAHQALADSYSGHLLYLVYEDCPEPPFWSWFCECNQDDEQDHYPDRASAEAVMRLHMALHDLPESAIYDVDEEEESD